MNTLIKTLLLSCILFCLNFSESLAAPTYDWTGASSAAWNTPGNWKVGGVTQTTNYPGSSASTDIVRIGVNDTFTNQPVLSGSTTIGSLTIGTLTATTLTINATLTVSGDITQKNNGNAGGITTNLTGTGVVTCANFYLGDSTAPPVPLLGLSNATYQTILNFTSLNLTVSQNLYLTTTASKTSLLVALVLVPAANVNNPVFNFNSGTISVGNQIQTVDSNDANVAGFLLFAAVSSSAQFLLSPSTGNSSTLNLNGSNALNLDGSAGYVDFYGAGGGTSTVNYSGSGNQEVYTSTTPYSFTRQSPTGLDQSTSIYQNLTFSGALTKKSDAGNLTIGQDLTLAASSTETVDFATNSPIVTVGGNFTSNSGTTLNQGGTGTMTIAGTSTNAGTINQTGSGNITFTGALSNSVWTATIAQTGSGAIIASGGITNSGTISQGSGTIGSITVTGALVNAGNISQSTGNIIINGGVTNSGNLNLGSANLNISGNYTNSGSYTQSNGTTLFNGSSAQTLQGGAGTGTQFNTVNFSGTGAKTMTSGNFSVSSTSVLTMIGSSTLAANGYLTLKSDANGSATVAAIPSGASITGNVNVQRFITGGSSTYRGYRLLSSPVSQGSGIYSINYLINSSYLTGTTGTGGGFNKTGNPTLYLYRENLAPLYTTFLNSNFRGINNINTPPNYYIDVDGGPYNIPVANGYLFFFRGDRNVASLTTETTTTYIPTNTTLTATGALNAGTITVKDWYTPASANLGWTNTAGNSTVQGFNLVGNPYASSIDWDNYSSSSSSSPIYAPSVTKYIYVLDPVSRNYGVYAAGAASKIGTNNASNIIASGQGFFVVATCSCAQLPFGESAKVNNQVTGLSLLMGKPVAYINDQHLRLQLAQDSINTDDIIINFRDTTKVAYVKNEDAPYKPGLGSVSLSSTSADSVALAINELPLPQQNSQTIRLNVNAKTDGIYQLNMKEVVGIPQLYDVWLMDAYKKDSLNMQQSKIYSFNIYKNDSSSFGSNRFSLLIRQNQTYSYQLLAFAAKKVPDVAQVQVLWKTGNEQNYTHFTVERSIDNGKTFDVLGSEKATAQGAYSLLDKNPVIGQNVYRLKQEDINNNITYSKTIGVFYTNLDTITIGNNLSIYPNPASNVINLATTKQPLGGATYDINFMSSSGNIIKKITSSQASWQGNISDLKPGIYEVHIINNKTQILVAKNKFIKL
ncbi:MAG: T9SS type A sorting domain-containing protein [Mucilaginibacter sp.]